MNPALSVPCAIAIAVLLTTGCSRPAKNPAPRSPQKPAVEKPAVEKPAALAAPVTVVVKALDEDDYVQQELIGVQTPVTITMPRAATSTALLAQVGRVFIDVRRRFGSEDTAAAVARVNKAAGTAAVAVDDDIRWLLSRALKLGRDTGGAFDVTSVVLDDGWRAVALGQTPTRTMLDGRLPLVAARDVVIDKDERTVALRRAGMKMSLDMMAVGYAMDGVAELLVAAGVTSFRIDAAGQVVVGGGKAGRQWRVDVPGDGFAAIDLWQGSVTALWTARAVTEKGETNAEVSGDDAGKKTAVIDPRNGHVVTAVRGAVVIGKDATMARARAMALVVVGPKDGLIAASTWQDVRVLLVDERHQMHMTPGLADALIVRRKPRE